MQMSGDSIRLRALFAADPLSCQSCSGSFSGILLKSVKKSLGHCRGLNKHTTRSKHTGHGYCVQEKSQETTKKIIGKRTENNKNKQAAPKKAAPKKAAGPNKAPAPKHNAAQKKHAASEKKKAAPTHAKNVSKKQQDVSPVVLWG